jgi:hypothetical protein
MKALKGYTKQEPVLRIIIMNRNHDNMSSSYLTANWTARIPTHWSDLSGTGSRECLGIDRFIRVIFAWGSVQNVDSRGQTIALVLCAVAVLGSLVQP